jgi:hypothetical protein
VEKLMSWKGAEKPNMKYISSADENLKGGKVLAPKIRGYVHIPGSGTRSGHTVLCNGRISIFIYG